MKKILLLIMTSSILLAESPGSGFPATFDTCCMVSINTNGLRVSYDTSHYSEYIAAPRYSEGADAIQFEAYIDIINVEIINMQDNSTEFILPVDSKKLRLSLNLFEQGDYSLRFNMKEAGIDFITFVNIEP